MATGKERGFKDWKGSKAFRESQRGFQVKEEIGSGPRKKNTRKWCKGKKNRKHVLALYNKYTWTHSRKCVNCGKEMWGPLKKEDFDFIEKSWQECWEKFH